MFSPTATRSLQESGGVPWVDFSNDPLALGNTLRGVQLCSPYPANIKEWKIKHLKGPANAAGVTLTTEVKHIPLPDSPRENFQLFIKLPKLIPVKHTALSEE